MRVELCRPTRVESEVNGLIFVTRRLNVTNLIELEDTLLQSAGFVLGFSSVTTWRHYGTGAVNGAFYPDGEPDESNLQSQEVWTGISYALASHLMLCNMTEEAWDTAWGVARVTYEGGFSFRTPEAWDAMGNFRAAMYLRPGAAVSYTHLTLPTILLV